MGPGEKSVDVVYVVASKLGSIGMGTTAFNAVNHLDKSGRPYNIFCRGYDSSLGLRQSRVKSYGFLETLSLPLRFLEKKMGLKINPFKYVNHFFGKLIERKLPRCKIYHTWMKVAPEAVLKAKREGATLVLEGANSHPMNVLQILNREYKKFGKEDLMIDSKSLDKEISLINQFDYVMCPSDFVYESFLNNGFKKNQLIKIPYGVDLDKYPKKIKKDSKFRVVFVGSIQLRKGVHYLLKAWEELKLKNAELVIVGRVWPDSLDVVEKYRKNKSIKFIGFTKDPSKYLRESDVFVSPSLEEGSALTCYEAMATGLPVIATGNTGTVVRDEVDGFIIPARDISSIKGKIKEMYRDPKKREAMGDSAMKRVGEFTWKNYGKNVYEFYKKILKERG